MKTLRTFIVDTNVLVAGLLSVQSESPTVKIVDAMLEGRLIFVLSLDLLREYRSVLLRPKLSQLHGLQEQEVDQLLAELTGNAVFHETIAESVVSAPDSGDDHLWNLLATAPEAILVTGDRLLLENPPAGCSVISPASCVALCHEEF